ncbi:MAG: glycosyltransferase family 2 protein [Candidatus Contendobacter sp.]
MHENKNLSARVAILIVNFGRVADTLECLDSLLQVSQPLFKVFLVDNGSGATEEMRLRSYANLYPQLIHFTALPKNYGFTGACNRLIEYIITNHDYQFILLLNNDTVVDPLFLTHMLEKINIEQRIEMIAAQMIKYDNRSIIDNLGITFYKSGLASNRRSVDDPLLGPCGGCALYTTDLLRQVYQETGEYFDDTFFCYAEDTDLAWRARLLGYDAGYAQDALVFHKGSLSSGGPNNDFILYHGIRNSLFVLLKNIPLTIILKNLGWMVLLHCAILMRYTVKGKLPVLMKTYHDFIYRIPLIRQKRQYLKSKIRIQKKQIKLLISSSFYEQKYLKSALLDLFVRSRKN